MTTETGGPAFPVPAAYSGGTVKDGMTLRDYFAAKAMQSLTYPSDGGDNQSIAKVAYAMADAMIAARTK